VVTCYGIFVSPINQDDQYIVSEYCNAGSLQDWLRMERNISTNDLIAL
jgi:hypothetical protein